jgi:hypothetical protein
VWVRVPRTPGLAHESTEALGAAFEDAGRVAEAGGCLIEPLAQPPSQSRLARVPVSRSTNIPTAEGQHLPFSLDALDAALRDADQPGGLDEATACAAGT